MMEFGQGEVDCPFVDQGDSLKGVEDRTVRVAVDHTKMVAGGRPLEVMGQVVAQQRRRVTREAAIRIMRSG
jgi:hypothetical protein